MSTSRITLLALACLASSLSARGEDDACTDATRIDPFACREVIVEYDPAAFDVQATADRLGLRLLGIIHQLERAWFIGPEGRTVSSLIADLSLEPGVIEAEPNQEFTSPECWQWNALVIELPSNALPALRDQPALRAMNADVAASPVALPGRGVTVAVVDTGVSRSHPVLKGRLARRGIDLVSGSALADDLGNGVDDDLDGVTDRGWGHGTAVAGLISLVAPGAHILPVRVLDDECQGTAFGIARGIIAAVDQGARVINASFGSIEDLNTIRRAVQYAKDNDVAVIAPAGNDGRDRLQFPAERSDAIAVAAVDSWLVAPAFTAHSSAVELSAPGVNVDVPYRSGYARVSGTSFSTALVSGAFALGFAYAPGLDRRDVLEVIQDTSSPVDPTNPDLDGELGEGVPDLAEAVRSFRALRRTGQMRQRTGTMGMYVLPGRTPTILTRD